MTSEVDDDFLVVIYVPASLQQSSLLDYWNTYLAIKNL